MRLWLPGHASANNLSAPMRSPGGYIESMEDKSKRNVVQKGRFSVLSENVDLAKVPDIGMGAPLRKTSQGSSPLKKSASVGECRFTKPVKHIQLEQELNALYCREEIEMGNEEIEGA